MNISTQRARRGVAALLRRWSAPATTEWLSDLNPCDVSKRFNEALDPDPDPDPNLDPNLDSPASNFNFILVSIFDYATTILVAFGGLLIGVC